MKKTMLFCLVLTFTFSLSAQEKKEIKVSDKVKTDLIKLYPNAKDVKWSREFETIRAMFLEEGKQVAVIFRADTLYTNMIEIELAALPETVKNHLIKYYKNYSTIRAVKIHFTAIPDEKNVCFGADITDGSITKRVICYPNGSEMNVTTLPTKNEMKK